jgi:hypothetical protein
MTEHHFTLRLDTSGVRVTSGEALERLAAAGCDDAIVGIGIPGRLALAFAREDGSAAAAVTSAIHDVLSAVPQAILIEASPDIVGLSDIADLVGRTRQNMRKLLLPVAGSPAGGSSVAGSAPAGESAPAPLHEGNPSLWHLAVVLEWLRATKAYTVSDDLLELARTTMQVNLAIQQRLVDSSAYREIERLVG